MRHDPSPFTVPDQHHSPILLLPFPFLQKNQHPFPIHFLTSLPSLWDKTKTAQTSPTAQKSPPSDPFNFTTIVFFAALRVLLYTFCLFRVLHSLNFPYTEETSRAYMRQDRTAQPKKSSEISLFKSFPFHYHCFPLYFVSCSVCFLAAPTLHFPQFGPLDKSSLTALHCPKTVLALTLSLSLSLAHSTRFNLNLIAISTSYQSQSKPSIQLYPNSIF